MKHEMSRSLPLETSVQVVIHLIRVRLGQGQIGDLENRLTGIKPDLLEVVSVIRQRQLAGLCFIPNYTGNDFLVEVMERLKPEISLRAGFNLVMYDKMLQVQSLFTEAGLVPVFYKGLALGMEIYGNLTTRFSSDIDILISKADFPRMRRLLTEHGFVEAYPYPSRYEGYFLRHTREAKFTSRGDTGITVSVELQWAPMSSVYGVPDNDEYFLHYTVVKEFAGRKVTSVRPEQHVLLLFIHHGIGDLWRSLRNVTDIAGYIHRYGDVIDWQQVRDRLIEWKMHRNALLGLHLANRLFDTKIPAVFSEQLGEKEISLAMKTLLAEKMLPREKKNLRNAYHQFRYLDDGYSRLRLAWKYALTMLYPSITDLNRITLPRYLFPVYFLLKPFRFLYREKRVRGAA